MRCKPFFGRILRAGGRRGGSIASSSTGTDHDFLHRSGNAKHQSKQGVLLNELEGITWHHVEIQECRHNRAAVALAGARWLSRGRAID
jgi:hypothetical protein